MVTSLIDIHINTKTPQRQATPFLFARYGNKGKAAKKEITYRIPHLIGTASDFIIGETREGRRAEGARSRTGARKKLP
jgi:hypothetical protein